MKFIPVSAMSLEEHSVQGHSSHQRELVVLVGGQDTKYGNFQAEAYALEECLEERIDTLGMGAVEAVSQVLRQHPHERHNSSEWPTQNQLVAFSLINP